MIAFRRLYLPNFPSSEKFPVLTKEGKTKLRIEGVEHSGEGNRFANMI